MDINKFIENFKNQFEDENFEVSEDSKFRTLPGWDSMTSLMLIAMFDEIYDTVVSSDDLSEAHTVKDLFNLIKK